MTSEAILIVEDERIVARDIEKRLKKTRVSGCRVCRLWRRSPAPGSVDAA